MYKQITLAIFAVSALASCASNYTVSTNLDKENFDNYFAVGKVQTYDEVKSLPKNHQFVAIVEGSSCQEKPHLAPPDEIDAKNEARRAANKLEANAIIFSECVTLQSDACISERLCYGKAYKVIADE